MHPSMTLGPPPHTSVPEGSVDARQGKPSTSSAAEQSVRFAKLTSVVPRKTVGQQQPTAAEAAPVGSTESDECAPVGLDALGKPGSLPQQKQQRKGTLVVPPLPTPSKVVWKGGARLQAPAAPAPVVAPVAEVREKDGPCNKKKSQDGGTSCLNCVVFSPPLA